MCLINFLLTCLNFFFLDRDVETCASYHGDKHLNKMQLEYAQIASTVVRQLSPSNVPDGTYKETHKNHPVVKWAKKSRSHVIKSKRFNHHIKLHFWFPKSSYQ